MLLLQYTSVRNLLFHLIIMLFEISVIMDLFKVYKMSDTKLSNTERVSLNTECILGKQESNEGGRFLAI